VVQVTAFHVAGNDLLEVGPPEPVRPFEPLLVLLNKGLLSLCHRNSAASILSRNLWVFFGGVAGVRGLSSGERYHLAEVAFALYVRR
jgi:hypothetical protein